MVDTPIPDDTPAEEASAGRDTCCLATQWERLTKRLGELPRAVSECTDQVREKTVGEIVDDTLELVRKKPGVGVAAAVAVGYCLGRLLRR